MLRHFRSLSPVCSCQQQRKHQCSILLALWEGNPLLTKASNTEILFMSWHHHVRVGAFFIFIHFRMMSSNGNIFHVTGPLWGESASPKWIPITKASDTVQSFDVFFDLRLNKPLSKQFRRWWFETSSCLLWHHCNVILSVDQPDGCWWPGAKCQPPPVLLSHKMTSLRHKLSNLQNKLYLSVISHVSMRDKDWRLSAKLQ